MHRVWHSQMPIKLTTSSVQNESWGKFIFPSWIISSAVQWWFFCLTFVYTEIDSAPNLHFETLIHVYVNSTKERWVSSSLPCRKMNHIVELKTYFHATLDYNPTVWGGTCWKWNFASYWTLNHGKGWGN